MENPDAAGLAVEVTIAWLGNPNTRAGPVETTSFLQAMYDRIAQPGAVEVPEAVEHQPAVTYRQSLAKMPEHIISMIDGKPYRTMRRHLTRHGLTPAEYRERYGLKPDYPVVAPAYSDKRRALAVENKLGHGTHPRTGGTANG